MLKVMRETLESICEMKLISLLCLHNFPEL